MTKQELKFLRIITKEVNREIKRINLKDKKMNELQDKIDQLNESNRLIEEDLYG